MPRKKTAPKSAGGLAFLVSTGIEKPDANTRMLIRSHVMLGKNAGRTLPSRKKRQGRDEASPSSEESTSSKVMHSLQTLPVCRRFVSPMSAIALADTIEPGDFNGILQLSSIAKQLLFPLEPVIFFERRYEDWTAPLATDSAYLHCQVFTAQSFFDTVRLGHTDVDVSISRHAMSHYIKAVRLLRDRLGHDDDRVRFSNSTIATITGFSTYALVTGDFHMASKHVEGLCRIVRVRGGTEAFFGVSEKFLVEILRRDLGLALTQGSKPIFATDVLVNEPLMQYPDLTPLLEQHGLTWTKVMPDTMRSMDGSMIEAWKTMAEFNTLINFAADTAQRIPLHTFLHTMTAVMYRLILMNFASSLLDERIRLGLLAFSSSIFLPCRSLGMSYAHMAYAHLASAIKKHLFCLTETDAIPKLNLWVMAIGALSLLDERDDWWLRPLFVFNADMCGVKTWEGMKELMQEFLWVGLVHDKPGQRLFDRLMKEGHHDR